MPLDQGIGTDSVTAGVGLPLNLLGSWDDFYRDMTQNILSSDSVSNSLNVKVRPPNVLMRLLFVQHCNPIGLHGMPLDQGIGTSTSVTANAELKLPSNLLGSWDGLYHTTQSSGSEVSNL